MVNFLVLSDLNDFFYRLEKKAQHLSDALVNSSVYGAVFYAGATIAVFLILIMLGFFLVMLFRK